LLQGAVKLHEEVNHPMERIADWSGGHALPLAPGWPSSAPKGRDDALPGHVEPPVWPDAQLPDFADITLSPDTLERKVCGLKGGPGRLTAAAREEAQPTVRRTARRPGGFLVPRWTGTSALDSLEGAAEPLVIYH
jgi:hypothetical protein